MMNSELLLKELINASTESAIDKLLAALPVVDHEKYNIDYGGKINGTWENGKLHWIPVGGRRGNSGPIKLAGNPINPIAERVVNGTEALIELYRLRELAQDPNAPMPSNPREAALRYFGLPRLDSVPHIADKEESARIRDLRNKVRKMLFVQLMYDKTAKEFAIAIHDSGMGQEPARIHETLLSLGETDKAHKPYLIGIFGQGGSSAFAASTYSVILSRRAKDLVRPKGDDGIGWTIVRQFFPKGRRDNYFAYLAASPTGAVPRIEGTAADHLGFNQGSTFTHIRYDFSTTSSAIARTMYQALNHVLFNPILPYDLFTLEKERPELMQGTAQRLAQRAIQLSKNRAIGRQSIIDKSFAPQPVG